MAIWLVNGPWDIDNDGDGLPDSVWVDFNLPTITSPEGILLRPMVAPLIEDLDGRINVNVAGNYNQLRYNRFNLGPIRYSNTAPLSFPASFQAVSAAHSTSNHGGGIGPAEIDFSHLFAFERGVPSGFVGPNSTTQTDATALTIDQVLQTRYGNLLNVRYGGPVYNYASPYPTGFLRFPGAGTRAEPATTNSIDQDVLSRIPFAGREIDHGPAAVRGRPVDLHGLATTFKDERGNHEFNALLTDNFGNERINQPYEFGATTVRGDDAPFSAAELVDFTKGGPLNGRLSQLLGDAADSNEALRRLLTTESRSVDSPEAVGELSVVHMFAERLQSAGLPNAAQRNHLSRMLAVELRKGSKLNLNRQLGNNDNVNPAAGTLGIGDTQVEDRTSTVLREQLSGTVNTANNRFSSEDAFSELDTRNQFFSQTRVNARYGSNVHDSPTAGTAFRTDFDGIDVNGDGQLTIGVDNGSLFDVNFANGVDGAVGGLDEVPDEVLLKAPDGAELLARQLYCLMYALLLPSPPAGDQSMTTLFPNFPYPPGFDPQINADDVRNRYVARRLAQWAANVVDYRDPDAKCTRLRYDPYPFDRDPNTSTAGAGADGDHSGFHLETAALNVVWGMERPEIELTETLAMHDKRERSDLAKAWDPANPSRTIDGEEGTVEGVNHSDSDMDQYRMPQASAFVELRALRPAFDAASSGAAQPSYPSELYTGAALDLGRTVGTGNATSPVWRLAVGQPTMGDPTKSTRFVFDADRLGILANAGPGVQDVPDYLTQNPSNPANALDWSTLDATAWDNQITEWRQVIGTTAEIRPSFLPVLRPPVLERNREFVSIADADLDPSDDNGAYNDSAVPPIQTQPPSNYRVELERFVWFSNLAPTNALRVCNDERSGMGPENVFFRRGNKAAPSPNLNDGNPENFQPFLTPGQFAVVAPRALTHFGEQSTGAITALDYEYRPSGQQFSFSEQVIPPPAGPFTGTNRLWRLDYFRNGVPNDQSPNYLVDVSTTPPIVNQQIGGVLPIICESFYPSEVDGAVADWATYLNATVPAANAAERVDMGFNISAPLPGANYYKAPTFRPASTYPLVDGYRDIENYVMNEGPEPVDGLVDASLGYGAHDDVPFDHVDPTNANERFRPNHTVAPPLIANDWAEIGTHEEARTVFLQRLADPTIPWDAVDNPYVTIDFMPIDLTTFNGEQDVRENVTRSEPAPMGPPTTNIEPIDPLSGWADPDNDGDGEFTTPVKLDTRRKIPDPLKDRVSTAVLAGVRTEITNRSTLTMTTNRLRRSMVVDNTITPADYWPFEIGSTFNNGSVEVANLARHTNPNPDPNRTPVLPDSTYQPSTDGLTLDNVNGWYTQSLGYVNREFGLPTPTNRNSGVFDIGGPENVYLSTVPWMDREYQSPYDLMNVPAASRTRLLAEFGPGTRLEDTDFVREVPERFEHLLGFDQPYGLRDPSATSGDWPHVRGADTTGRLPLGVPQDAAPGTDITQDLLTGERSPFERIFDYVDIGPVWFDSQHWFDPTQVRFRFDNEFSGFAAPVVERYEMFNRTVETLQPPNNYIGLHRTPGKLNVNTSPDYARKGPNADTNSLNTHFLDGYENTNPAVTIRPSVPAGMVWENPEDPYLSQRDTTNFSKEIQARPSNFPISADGFTTQFAASELYANGSIYQSFAWAISNGYDLDSAYEIPSTMGENNQYEWTVASPFGRGFKAFIESRRGYSMTTPGIDINSDLVSDVNLLNPTLDYRYPTRFAGLFSVHRANETPSVQRFMRIENQSHTFRVPAVAAGQPTTPPPIPLSFNHATNGDPVGLPRRTYDMSLLRIHPDFDQRTLSPVDQAAVETAADTRYSLNVEADAINLVDPSITGPSAPNGINDGDQTVGDIGLVHPGGTNFVPGAIGDPQNNPTTQLRMPMLNTGLFERSDAELHHSLVSHDRDSYFRHKNAARLANVTTHHSNVYMVRLTLGYFVVDPETGAVGDEYINATGEPLRSRATYVIDRSIPVGFLRGESIDTSRTILFEEIEE